MKRKLLNLVLAAALMVTGVGCTAQKTAESATTQKADQTTTGSANTTSGNKDVKIAVGLPDSGATMFSLMSNNVKALAETAGVKVVFQGGVGASADATVAFVENQIAAGAKGILFSPPSDSVLPTVSSLCNEAGVYWGITFRDIKDEQIKKAVESSKYYVGRVFENEEDTGYRVMQNLNKVGAKKVAIISMPKGNTTTDSRELGANKAAKEFGMKIVSEARNITQAADATSAAQSFLTAYGDLDAIFIVGATGAGIHEAVAKAIEDSGRQDKVKIATIDFPNSMGELFKKGILATCSGLPSWGYDPYMSFTLLVNSVMGNPVSDEKVTLNCTMFDINDTETADKWLKKFGDANTLYYSKDDMKKLIKANNQNLTVESMQNMINDFSKNAVK